MVSRGMLVLFPRSLYHAPQSETHSSREDKQIAFILLYVWNLERFVGEIEPRTLNGKVVSVGNARIQPRYYLWLLTDVQRLIGFTESRLINL
jgi:hypothetical protein